MKKTHGFLGVFALLAAAPLTAADKDAAGDDENSPAAAPDAKKPDSTITVEGQKEDKPICHREIVTGSIRTVKVCLTREQIEDRKRQSDANMLELREQQEIYQKVRDAKNSL